MALFGMSPLKAPGPNGLPAGFYQRACSTVGSNIINFAHNFFNSSCLPKGINETFLTLIPKVAHPERASQLRPISLCNVEYKIITKALMNRMKVIMPNLIGPYQCSFVPGRQITDNIVIYQEILHSIRKKRDM